MLVVVTAMTKRVKPIIPAATPRHPYLFMVTIKGSFSCNTALLIVTREQPAII